MAELRSASEMKDSGVKWLSEIPKAWSVIPLKYIYCITNGRDPETLEGPTPVYGSGSKSFKTCIESKDGPAVLLGRKGTVNIPQWVEGKYWNVDTAFDVKPRSDKEAVLKFLYYCAICFDYDYYTTKTSLPSMTMGIYYNYRIPHISKHEQQAIVNYLDDRCSKIDEIIAEATASIEEYKELKQAVIFEAVTKGINNLPSEHRKELDWADNVCLQWPIYQIRYLYRLRNEKNDLPLDKVNLISLYTDRGVIQHSDINKETITGNKAVTADGYKIVYPNDIVVNIILCWMGAMGISNYYGVTSPAYDIYEPIDTNMVNSRYYHYLFRTDRFAKKCYTLGRGIMMMRWRTYSSEFRSIKVPVPSIAEQNEIADYLDERTMQIDALIAEKQSLIDDLQAYKKSLIYEVVTGKRRVV